IPEKKIFISAEPRAVTQRYGTIFRLFALQNRCRAAHLIARMYSEPANSEITGTLSRNRPTASNRSTRGTGVLGWRKSKETIRTRRQDSLIHKRSGFHNEHLAQNNLLSRFPEAQVRRQWQQHLLRSAPVPE